CEASLISMGIGELEESVRATGVFTPIVVRRIDGDAFELIAGERRLRAARVVHGDDYLIPVNVIEADDREAAMVALIENVQREGMSPSEEAEAAAHILALCGGDRQDAAKRLGMSTQTLDARLQLMNASAMVREALTERRILLGHAELLAALPKLRQDEVLPRLLAQPRMPSVDECRTLLQQVARVLGVAIFDKEECAACPHNSEQQASMFTEAIASGHCTNGSCFDAKTEAQLQHLLGGLEGEYPRKEIVRAGDNYRVIRLVADGPKGVGAEQAGACKACSNFGAAVMGTPDALGRVIHGACFDATCNTKMVAANLRANATKAADSAPSGGQPAQQDVPKTAPKTSQPLTAIVVTGQVQEYRKRLWRDALTRHVRQNTASGIRLVIAAAMAGQARNVLTDKLLAAISALPGQSPPPSASSIAGPRTQLVDALVYVDEAPDQARGAMVVELGAQMVELMADADVCQALKFFEVDLRSNWQLDNELLRRLTKSEIEFVAREIGLDKSLGEGLKAAVAKKKDELIADLLGIPNHNYSAVLPRFLDFTSIPS
ncbi:MAG: PRTRC system ParB family protein, partial [Inhella sp.]